MKKNYLVLTQYRPTSKVKSPYKDLVGVVYHFPEKHIKQMRAMPAEFVYYEPAKFGEDVYFGRGVLGEVTEDTEFPGRYFAKIEEYNPFATPVPFLNPESQKPYEVNPNKQNSVRTITPSAFENICFLGGTQLSFISDAHLMRVLGEHLISSEKVGILELVKNAYDANAALCTVRIESVAELPSSEIAPLFPELKKMGPIVAIWDDGDGMDESIIRNGWARPATVTKTVVKEELRKAFQQAGRTTSSSEFEDIVRKLKGKWGGRLPLGEKGVGRFAAHRLGRYLWLRTKTKASPYELELKIDWDEFDAVTESPRDLSGIHFSLKRQKPTWERYSKEGTGTVLVIYGGRQGYEWDKTKLKEIDSAIATFKSPTKAPEGFDVEFQTPQLPPEEKIINPTEWESPFEITAIVDEKGCAEGEIRFDSPPILTVPLASRSWKFKDENIWDEEISGKPSHGHAPQLQRAPECGGFYLRVRLWLRQREWMPESEYKNIVSYLQTRGGISIYRDGLAVIPAAVIAERDWLQLTVRGRKKASKVSYYNMLGEVELIQAQNLALIDTTSRESLLETVPFMDLGRLVRSLVIKLENVYLQVREEYAEKVAGPVPDNQTLRSKIRTVSSLLEHVTGLYESKVSEDPIIKAILAEAGQAIDIKQTIGTLKSIPEWIEKQRDEQEGLLEISGFALSVSVSLHEITKIAAALYQKSSVLHNHLKGHSSLKVSVGEMSKLAGSLLDEMRRLEPLKVTRIEPSNVFELEDAIRSAMGIFYIRCRELNIKTDIQKMLRDFRIYGRYGAVSQVFANLFDNAIYWMSRTSIESGTHKLTVQCNPNDRTVIVADTGSGIDPLLRPNLFKPFYSLKNPPSGIGLFVTKHYMAQLRGTIRLAMEKERIDNHAGAQFILDFSKTPTGPSQKI